MSDKSFNGLVKTVVERLGIDRTGKNTSNQSLRTSTFNAQVNIVHKWQFAVHFSSYLKSFLGHPGPYCCPKEGGLGPYQ